MERMQSDWVSLANKWQMDQEASLASSRSIKASLQAQVEEQRRKIEEIYQEQREQKEKKEQEKKEKAEKERRAQEEKAKQRLQAETRRLEEQKRREAARARAASFAQSFGDFAKKKPNPNKPTKSFDEILNETEDAILKWSDETHHKLRTMLNGLGKKVWKAKDQFLQQADRAYQQARDKIVKAWSDFYAAVHAPNDGFMEKAAPVLSTVLFATAAAALTEGTSRFVRYMQDQDY